MHTIHEPSIFEDLAMEELESIWELEDLVNGDEAKCESRHHEGTTCSGTVTHRFIATTCEPRDAKICTNIAKLAQSWIDQGVYCRSCMKPCRTHWRVFPI